MHPDEAASAKGDEDVIVSRWRVWHVVNVETEGCSFSVDDHRHDAALAAERWWNTCGPATHRIELVTYEQHSMPAEVVNREVVKEPTS